MRIFDSHAHLNSEEFDKDFEQVIERAFQRGVRKFIVPGYDLESSYLALKLSEKYPGIIYASVGIHPHEADGFEEWIEEIENLAGEKNVVAVGETGLDYYKNFSSRERQKDSFIAHIDIARRYNKPLIIHTRRAFGDIFSILKKEKGIRGIFHCFSGGKEEALFVQKIGFYISFSGSITYDSQKLKDALLNTSPEKLLVETDAPYLIPRPFKGRCEPFHIIYTLEKISFITGKSLEEISENTYKNAEKIFGLTKS